MQFYDSTEVYFEADNKVIKLAIAEDNELFRVAFKNHFRKLKTVNFLFVAKNGYDLLEQLKTREELPDIIFMDYKMPMMDGMQATIVIKREYPSIKVIMLSLFRHDYLINTMICVGAMGYLSKNADPEILVKSIHEVMEDKYFIETDTGIFETFSSFSKSKRYKYFSKPLELTDKQKQFIQLSATDLSYQGIANKMKISIKTVDNYRDMLFKRFNVTNRIGLLIFAVQNGLTDIIK
jgi:DNA-binding NarL/FixJ family response regulator